MLLKLLRCFTLVLLIYGVTYPAAASSPKTTYETIELASAYLVKHQNADGGWPLLPGEESDSEITAMVMTALMLKGWGTGASVIRKGVTYLVKHQRPDGSWNGNTAHTVFALVALTRAETDPEARLRALKWLRDAQNTDGSWGREALQPGNPLYTAAVLAGLRLLGFTQTFSAVPPAAEWLAERINYDGGWAMARGARSEVAVTAWVLQGLSLVYDIDEQIVWLKQMQNDDGGFGRYKGSPSDPEISAYAVLALTAGEDPLNTDKVAMAYLQGVQGEDGAFASATPIELKEAKPNLQTTAFVLWAIYARDLMQLK